ncbi:hypothetical protein RUND412_009193 [Rhizina undulata]
MAVTLILPNSIQSTEATKVSVCVIIDVNVAVFAAAEIVKSARFSKATGKTSGTAETEGESKITDAKV